MTRRNPSPVRIIAANNSYDQRQNMIRKFKQQLTIARGREKQCAILKNYLQTIIQKIKHAQFQNDRSIVDLKQKLQYTQKALNQYKKQVQILKKDLKAAISQLSNLDNQEAQLRKLLTSKTVQIDRLKTDIIVSSQDKARLVHDNFRLKSQQEILLQQMRRFYETLRHREGQSSQINSKIIEVKAYIQQLTDDNKLLKQRLKNYELENNDLNEDLGDKESNIDVIQENFLKKHDQISQSIENYIELQHKNEKIKKQIQHKNNLIRNQNQNLSQTNELLKRIDKALNQRDKQVKQANDQCNQIDHANNQIYQHNRKMKEDLIKCQQHFENLMRNNANLQQYMDTYIREDQLIINVIRSKRVIPLGAYNKDLRSSHINANLKNSGRTTF